LSKNTEDKRDADVHQTKMGNQWYFGMKAHVGVDAQTVPAHFQWSPQPRTSRT
jgi:transposase, IS5 family